VVEIALRHSHEVKLVDSDITYALLEWIGTQVKSPGLGLPEGAPPLPLSCGDPFPRGGAHRPLLRSGLRSAGTIGWY
jgi:hypothetical protein